MPEVIINGSGPQYALVVNPDGSINVSGIDISIGSLSLALESVYVQSGNNLHLGSAWTNIGSVVVSNFGQIGSVATQGIIGSVAVSNTLRQIDAGSVIVTNTVAISGNLGITFDAGDYLSVVQSGTAWAVSGIVNQGTNPWVISGTTNVSGAVGILTSAGSIGVYAGTNTIFGISGTLIGVSGIVNQGTSPWITSGTATVAGSVYTTGSINQGTTPWMISGLQWSVGISGAIIQGTSPWITSGTATIAGSAFVTGSINIATTLLPVSGIAFNVSRTAVVTNRQIANSGTSTQLTAFAIPNGYDVTIKALNTNTSQIGVGSQTTFNVGSLFNLYPNDSVRLGVDNTNRIFFMTQTTNDGLEIITEI
mgnify:CR=1 FL=1